MCVVSMIGDYYHDKWTPVPVPGVHVNTVFWPQPVSEEEFAKLKHDVLEMKELLKRAKIYDERTGQKDCEMEEKVAVLKAVAKLVGVDLSDIFVKKADAASAP